MQIVDIEDPTAPIILPSYKKGFDRAHNLWITDNYLYVCGASQSRGEIDSGMLILNLEPDPENPVQVGVYKDYYVHDIYVRDNRGYAACIEAPALVILDLAYKSDPKQLAHHTYPWCLYPQYMAKW